LISFELLTVTKLNAKKLLNSFLLNHDICHVYITLFLNSYLLNLLVKLVNYL